MTQNRVIPLCQSEFLEDLSIEFGRRFVPRHPWYGFEAEVDQCEYEGVPLEKLTLRASTFHDTQVILELWEDRSLRIGVILQATPNNGEFRLWFCRECAEFSSDRIAEAFRDSVAVSTRLCYSESPLPILRRLWGYDGEVQTTGSLGPRPMPLPDTPPGSHGPVPEG